MTERKFILLLLIILISGCTSPQLVGRDVEFVTEDSVAIKGTLYTPFDNRPVIILIHQMDEDRTQWNKYIPLFLERNYSVLTYDIRGMGESTKMSNGDDFVEGSIDDMPKDVKAAIAFLATREDIDKTKIAIVGASIGGNIAYVAGGAYPQVKAVVSISPSAGVLLGNGIFNFFPKRTMFMSDEAEARDADLLYQNTQDPKEIRQYRGAGHGIRILDNELAVQDMFNWLSKLL